MEAQRRFDLKIEDHALKTALMDICSATGAAGGRALVVGGSVRDSVLGIAPKDLDIEVYGLSPDRLAKILSERFITDLVGQAFGVIKLHGLPIDVSIPRRGSIAGLGHQGFEDESDPSMPPEEAASRRDFTMNAMAVDPMTGEVIDPYGGLRDLEQRILRHTSEKFSEDPLRVLRGMQFAARFELQPAPETVAICQTLGPEGLAHERICEEWRKLVLLGSSPLRGLQFLRDTGWVKHYPELENLIDCPQDPGWHPEGDVWTHTCHAMDAFADERIGDEWEDLVVGLGVLCHDLGKPSTTKFEDGKIRSRGHEEAGEGFTRSFLRRITNQKSLVQQVVPLVRTHLRPSQLFEARSGNRAIRRLAVDVGRIDRLVRVAKADKKGRPPIQMDSFPAGDWLLEKARALSVQDARPEHLVTGRHLIDLGFTPGSLFKKILDEVYEEQIEGTITTSEEGVEYVRENYSKLQ